MVEEENDGIDTNLVDVHTLKSPVSGMQQYAVIEDLNYNKLDHIAGDAHEVDYDNLSEVNKKRCKVFVVCVEWHSFKTSSGN